MILAIIQARLDSTRLPGKVLMDLGGKSVLAHVIERVRSVKSVDFIIVATTYSHGGGSIAGHCEDIDVPCFQWDGPDDDVLGRFVACLQEHPAGYVMRVCGDSPLLDSQSCDVLLAAAVDSNADYTGYRIGSLPAISKPTGYVAEVVSSAALHRLNRELPTDDPQREHVTQGIYANANLVNPYSCKWLSMPSWWKKEKQKYMALDTEEDLERIREAVVDG